MSVEEVPQLEDEIDLREELLGATAPETTQKAPKISSKAALINKIIEVSERDFGVCEYSRTKLKRMNKAQLTDIMAELIEKGLRAKMARTVGVDDENCDDRTIALGALRMLHDVCAVATERGGNQFLQPRGYEIVGFTAALKEPTVSMAIDGCLQEIADENTELLEYVKSPYTRLGIAWAGAICFSCKKVKHAPYMEPQQASESNTLRRRSSRRQASRQKHAPAPPTGINVKTV